MVFLVLDCLMNKEELKIRVVAKSRPATIVNVCMVDWGRVDKLR